MAERRFNLTYIAMFIAIFPLTVFILSAINVKVKPVSTILEEIKSSINDYPLSELEYASNCKDKYNGNLYKFPGTQVGCTCVNVNNYYYDQTGKHEVNPGTCSHNQTLNGCEEVTPVRSRKIEKWINGKFCSKNYTQPIELKGYLHYLNSSVLEKEECQNGYKKCGKLDNMGNYLCLPEEEECPINDIIVSDKERDDLENYNYILIGNKFYYYSNSTDKPIITKLKVVEGKMCMDRSYYYTEYPQYILDNNFPYYGCQNKIEGKLYDDNIEYLDYRKKKDFYLEDGFNLNEYFSQWYYDFPFYSLEAKMSLYPQRYIGYDKQCLIKNGVLDPKNNPFEEKKIKEMDKVIVNAVNKNNFTKWFSIISFILELLSLATFCIDKDSSIFIWIWTIINCLLYCSMAIPLFLNLDFLKTQHKLPLCGNNITNIKIKYYYSTQKTLRTTIIISLVCIHLQLLYNIILIIVRYTLQFEEGVDNNRENLINKKCHSSDIEYQRTPEEPYYKNSDDNQRPPEEPYYNNTNNPNINSAASSGVDEAKPQDPTPY